MYLDVWLRILGDSMSRGRSIHLWTLRRIQCPLHGGHRLGGVDPTIGLLIMGPCNEIVMSLTTTKILKQHPLRQRRGVGSCKAYKCSRGIVCNSRQVGSVSDGMNRNSYPRLKTYDTATAKHSLEWQ